MAKKKNQDKNKGLKYKGGNADDKIGQWPGRENFLR